MNGLHLNYAEPSQSHLFGESPNGGQQAEAGRRVLDGHDDRSVMVRDRESLSQVSKSLRVFTYRNLPNHNTLGLNCGGHNPIVHSVQSRSKAVYSSISSRDDTRA